MRNNQQEKLVYPGHIGRIIADLRLEILQGGHVVQKDAGVVVTLEVDLDIPSAGPFLKGVMNLSY